MSSGIWTLLALAGSLGGVLLSWKAWQNAWQDGGPNGRARPLMAAAGALAVFSLALWAAGYGAEIGIPLALETGALIAFGFILTRMEVRPLREMRARTAPPLPAHSRWKGVARFATAGVLGFAAAIGLGVLFATRAPLGEQTRLILGALAVPSLWSGAIAWTACDRRLLPQTLVFSGIAAVSAAATLATSR